MYIQALSMYILSLRTEPWMAEYVVEAIAHTAMALFFPLFISCCLPMKNFPSVMTAPRPVEVAPSAPGAVMSIAETTPGTRRVVASCRATHLQSVSRHEKIEKNYDF